MSTKHTVFALLFLARPRPQITPIEDFDSLHTGACYALVAADAPVAALVSDANGKLPLRAIRDAFLTYGDDSAWPCALWIEGPSGAPLTPLVWTPPRNFDEVRGELERSGLNLSLPNDPAPDFAEAWSRLVRLRPNVRGFEHRSLVATHGPPLSQIASCTQLDGEHAFAYELVPIGDPHAA